LLASSRDARRCARELTRRMQRAERVVEDQCRAGGHGSHPRSVLRP
jgi:hypothetical protein